MNPIKANSLFVYPSNSDDNSKMTIIKKKPSNKTFLKTFCQPYTQPKKITAHEDVSICAVIVQGARRNVLYAICPDIGDIGCR